MKSKKKATNFFKQLENMKIKRLLSIAKKTGGALRYDNGDNYVAVWPDATHTLYRIFVCDNGKYGIWRSDSNDFLYFSSIKSVVDYVSHGKLPKELNDVPNQCEVK